VVILSNRKHIEEIRRAPDDELSLMEASIDVSNCPVLLELTRIEYCRQQFNTRYTLGDEVHDIPYHAAVIRSQLTRNIGKVYPEIRDEVVTSFDEVLDLRGNGEKSFFHGGLSCIDIGNTEWKSVSTLSAIQKVVCRTSNRVFVGLPLCMFSSSQLFPAVLISSL
jgi:hypothetical protein